jgi:hypothetical protein
VEDHQVVSLGILGLPSENKKAPRRHDVGPSQDYAVIKKALGIGYLKSKKRARGITVQSRGHMFFAGTGFV